MSDIADSASDSGATGEGVGYVKPRPPLSKKGRKVRQPSKQLQAFRAVATQPEEEDSGPLEDHLRNIWRTDPKGFHQMWQKAETDHRSGLRKDREGATTPSGDAGGGVAGKGNDLGTEKCLGLIEQLLKEKGWEK